MDGTRAGGGLREGGDVPGLTLPPWFNVPQMQLMRTMIFDDLCGDGRINSVWRRSCGR
jgi:hypothetical protein